MRGATAESSTVLGLNAPSSFVNETVAPAGGAPAYHECTQAHRRRPAVPALVGGSAAGMAGDSVAQRAAAAGGLAQLTGLLPWAPCSRRHVVPSGDELWVTSPLQSLMYR